MCGLLGIYKFNNAAISEGEKQSFSCALETHLKRRGPDNSYSLQIAENLLIGGNRLAIRCSASVGNMPFTSNHITCCYNGELYNYADFMECESDGEIIIPLFIEHGIEFIRKLDGEFSIVLYDSKNDDLFLIRDYFGTKPLFFSLTEKEIIWGSTESSINEIKQHRLCKTIKDAVYQHTFTTMEPYTNFDGIWKIPPGHYIHISDGNVRLKSYNCWSKTNKAISMSALYEKIRSVFRKRLSHNDVIAIPLSAGIDSGIIAFLADEMNVKYEIFSVDKMLSKETEETKGIHRRLDKLKNYSDINLIDISNNLYEEAINNVFNIGYYDSFRLDSGMIPAYALYKEINKKNIRVAVDGVGGDELFHGYSFRSDFKSIEGWPKNFESNPYYYSMYSTLLSYTEKSDRAAGYFSIENRVPFQSKLLMEIAMSLPITELLKWPLRDILIKKMNYGHPSSLDKYEKYGFSLKNADKTVMHQSLKNKWFDRYADSTVHLVEPSPFPFKIGEKCQ